MLALIARFVVEDIADLNISDEVFLQHQLTEIRSHVESAPKEQQQKLVLEWIKEYAERYRQEWQRNSLSRVVVNKRCVDCPLIRDGSTSYCVIHSKWVALLEEYISDKIGSEKYIEETLDLLTQHKSDLKISEISSRMQS
jgi:uncharacterized protein YdiU (UPF0061 family)